MVPSRGLSWMVLWFYKATGGECEEKVKLDVREKISPGYGKEREKGVAKEISGKPRERKMRKGRSVGKDNIFGG